MASSPNRRSVTMRQAKPTRPTIKVTSTQGFRPELLVRLVSPAPSPPNPTIEKTAPPMSIRTWLIGESGSTRCRQPARGDDGQEHQKSRPPGPVIEDRSGDRGRDAAGDSRGGGPDADRARFSVGGKGLPEHGKAVGKDQGFAQALQEPADDEGGETRREARSRSAPKP